MRGRIIDEPDKKPVPFALVFIEGTQQGTTADINGRFEMRRPDTTIRVVVQVIGYQKKTFEIRPLEDELVLSLRPDTQMLKEVVVMPGINPAIAIMRKVLENKSRNDINKLPYYQYKTYSKTYITLSDESGDELFYLDDTALTRKTPTKDQHLFMMESVTEKKYRYRNKHQQKVIASRVSGFKSAPFAAFSPELASVTFYDDHVELLGVRYLSPLASGTFKRYRFVITDTIAKDADTTILIRFDPKGSASFKALKGVLYISKSDYALANVLAEPALTPHDGNSARIQQLYEKTPEGHWFPKQIKTEILFHNTQTEKTNSHTIIGKAVSRINIRDVRTDTQVVINNKNIVSYNAKGFDRKDSVFWQQERDDELDVKERRTYEVLDSVGEKENFDRKIKMLADLPQGRIRLGYFSFAPEHLIRYNRFEGFRAGFGAWTSDQLSPWWSIGAYTAYGFRDKAWKYGGMLRVNLNSGQNHYLLAEASRDVTETAGHGFLDKNSKLLSTENLRDILINRMDYLSGVKMSLRQNFLNGLNTSLYFLSQTRHTGTPYLDPENNTVPVNSFHLHETGIQVKYWPGEKFTGSFGKLVSTGSHWPVFFLNVSRGFSGNIGGYRGDFDYTRTELKISHQFNFKVKGFLALQVLGGSVSGRVPYSLLYNYRGSFATDYYVSVANTFETMALNEFAARRFGAFFVSLNSGRLFTENKYSNPELELVHHYGIGVLAPGDQVTSETLSDLSRGFTEAGVRLKNLFRSQTYAFGAGVFYRYGHYAHPRMKDNFVFKGVLGIAF